MNQRLDLRDFNPPREQLKKSVVLAREKKEAAVRAKLMPLVKSGHVSLSHLEQELSFAVGLNDSQLRTYLHLRAKHAEESSEVAEERKALRAAAGLSV